MEDNNIHRKPARKDRYHMHRDSRSLWLNQDRDGDDDNQSGMHWGANDSHFVPELYSGKFICNQYEMRVKINMTALYGALTAY